MIPVPGEVFSLLPATVAEYPKGTRHQLQQTVRRLSVTTINLFYFPACTPGQTAKNTTFTPGLRQEYGCFNSYAFYSRKI